MPLKVPYWQCRSNEASYYVWRSELGGKMLPNIKRRKDLKAERRRHREVLERQIFVNDVITGALQ